MNIIIAEIIGIFLLLLFVGFISGVFIKFSKSIFGIITTCVFALALSVLGFFLIDSLSDKVKEDYRCVDQIAIYDICNMSYEGSNIIVYYLDTNKEVKHIKSDKVKVYYDLNDDHEPYAVRNQYWRWFIYWEELEVHIRE